MALLKALLKSSVSLGVLKLIMGKNCVKKKTVSFLVSAQHLLLCLGQGEIMMAYSGHFLDIAAVTLTFKSLTSAMSFYWQLTVATKYD